METRPAVLEILAGRVALGVQEGHSLLVVLGDPSGQYDPCGLGFQGLQAGPFLLVILCHLWFQGLPSRLWFLALQASQEHPLCLERLSLLLLPEAHGDPENLEVLGCHFLLCFPSGLGLLDGRGLLGLQVIRCYPVGPLVLWDPVVLQVQCHHLFLVILPFQGGQ